MSLYEDAMVDCVMVDKSTVADGEGGFSTSWTESAPFQAAIVNENSTLSQIAEKSGVTGVYSVITHRNIKLKFPDVIKRVKDGQYFRITSKAGENETPGSASIDIAKVKAELWNLTN